MKKFINKYLLVALSAIAFAACSDDDNYTPGEPEPAGRQNIFFSTQQVSAYEVDPSDPTEFDITIYRDSAKMSEAVTMPLEVQQNDENVFNVPQSVTFEAGKTEANIHVTYPNAEEGITYNLIVNVPNDYMPIYEKDKGICSYKTSVTRIKWENIGECYWIDGIIPSLFNIQQLPLAVQTERAVVGDEVRYRFDSPYASVCNEVSQLDDNPDHMAYIGHPYNEPADLIGNVEKMIIRVTNGGAHLNQFHLGSDWGYGDWIAGTIYGQLSNDNSYPLGKYDKDAQTITFPAKSLFFYLPTNGTYICSKASTFCLTKEACAALCYSDEEASWTPAYIGQYQHCFQDLTGTGSMWDDQIDGEAILYVNENNDSQYCIDPWVNEPLFFTWNDDGTVSVDMCSTGVESQAGTIYASDVVTAGMSDDLFSGFDDDNGAFIFNLVWHVEDGRYFCATQDVFVLTGQYGDEQAPRMKAPAKLKKVDRFYVNKKAIRQNQNLKFKDNLVPQK